MTSDSQQMRQRLKAEQVSQLCQVLPLSLGASLPVALLAVVLLWSHTNHLWAVTWLACLFAISAVRLAIFRDCRRRLPGEFARMPELAPRVRATSIAAGACWGCAALLLYVPGDLVHQLLLVLLLAGVTAGAATSMAADRRVALCFQLPVLVPLALRLAADADTLHLGITSMVVCYTVFLCFSVYRLNAHNTQNIELRLQALRREQALFESETRYRQLALQDPLTGLPNRFALQNSLHAVLAGAEQSGGRVALLYLDLDDFKDVNDSRGHGSGDRVLVEVAERLRGCVRTGEMVARMGGDEFIVISTDAASREDVEQLARRIRSAVAAPIQLEGESFTTRVSIGVGLYPDDGADATLLMQHADIALYQAKEHGQHGIRFYDSAMSAAVAERLYLEQALLRALEAGEIHVEYQPLVSLPGGAVTGFEALARWRHPERGLIPPATFIAIAERCGLIERLGERVLREVVRQQAQWRDELLPTVPVAINVSPRQLEGGQFARLVEGALRAGEIAASALQFEITESLLMRHTEEVFAELDALRRLGARVAIDDFGTGYSSLSYLKHLPIDCIKIDRSFVRDMLNDERDAAIVSAIVDIGHSLGLRVVAEGVETVHQANSLVGLGCDAAQGYYFHKPLGAQQCRELLRHLGQTRPMTDTARLRLRHWLRPRLRERPS